jgi:fibronectin type 3 domain-containing protein
MSKASHLNRAVLMALAFGFIASTATLSAQPVNVFGPETFDSVPLPLLVGPNETPGPLIPGTDEGDGVTSGWTHQTTGTGVNNGFIDTLGDTRMFRTSTGGTYDVFTSPSTPSLFVGGAIDMTMHAQLTMKFRTHTQVGHTGGNTEFLRFALTNGVPSTAGNMGTDAYTVRVSRSTGGQPLLRISHITGGVFTSANVGPSNAQNWDGEDLDVTVTWIPLDATTTVVQYEVVSSNGASPANISGVETLAAGPLTVDTAVLRFESAFSRTYLDNAEVIINDALPAPGPPGSLMATAGPFQNQVRLDWTAAAGVVFNYNIYRDIVPGFIPGPLNLVDSVSPRTVYIDTDPALVNGIPYHYIVRAENTTGESGNSNEATATPNAGLGAATRVVELFEDPLDPNNDDGDAGFDPVGTADVVTTPPSRLVGYIDDHLTTGDETLQRGLSGLLWGGFNAATVNPAENNQFRIRLEQLTGSSGAVEFADHSLNDAGAFVSPYNTETGSYIYTIFSFKKAHPLGPNPFNIADSVDLSGPTAVVKTWWQINSQVDSPVRILLRDGSGNWYHSAPVVVSDSNFAVSPDDESPEDNEGRFLAHLISSIGPFTQVSAAAEASMNAMTDADEVPLGPTQAGVIDLTTITGMGILLADLLTSNNDHLMLAGMILDPVLNLSAPANLDGQGLMGGGVALDWDDNSGFETITQYNVYRDTSPGVTADPGNLIGSEIRNDQSDPAAPSDFTDTTAVANTVYFYVVTAVNATGESAVSNEFSIRAPGSVSGIETFDGVTAEFFPPGTTVPLVQGTDFGDGVVDGWTLVVGAEGGNGVGFEASPTGDVRFRRTLTGSGAGNGEPASASEIFTSPTALLGTIDSSLLGAVTLRGRFHLPANQTGNVGQFIDLELNDGPLGAGSQYYRVSLSRGTGADAPLLHFAISDGVDTDSINAGPQDSNTTGESTNWTAQELGVEVTFFPLGANMTRINWTVTGDGSFVTNVGGSISGTTVLNVGPIVVNTLSLRFNNDFPRWFIDNVEVAVQSLITAAPDPVSGLTATAGPFGNMIALDWDDSPDPDFTYYRIYRDTNTGVTSGASPLVAIVNDSFFIDNHLLSDPAALPNGDDQFYVVVAVNRTGASADSAEVSATPDAGLGRPRVEEFFEDPIDEKRDLFDNNFETLPHAPSVQTALFENGPGIGPSIPFNQLGLMSDNSTTGGLRIYQSLSGLSWAAFNARLPGPAQPIQIGSFITDQSGLRIQNIDVNSSDLPTTYSASNATYLYSVFEEPGRHRTANVQSNPATIDLSGANAVIKTWWNLAGGSAALEMVRYLVRDGSGEWFVSSPAPITDDAYTVAQESNDTDTKDRQESRFDVITVSSLTWEQVPAAARDEMNQFDDDGEVPLGTLVPGNPDLTDITGMGVVLSELSTTNSQDFLLTGMILDQDMSNDPPANLVGTSGNESATLDWDVGDGKQSITEYRVYRSLVPGIDPATSPSLLIATIEKGVPGQSDPIAVTFTDVGPLTNGVSYFYVVTAVNALGESVASNEVEIIPADVTAPEDPTGLMAVSGQADITLSWTASADSESDLAGYNVYRSTAPGVAVDPGNLLGTVGPGTTMFVDNTAAASTFYFYVVTAFDEDQPTNPGNAPNESSGSNEVRSSLIGAADPPVGTPDPTTTEVIASETWNMVSAFAAGALPDGPTVVDSDMGFAAHAGGANLSDIEFVTINRSDGFSSIRLQRTAAGATVPLLDGMLDLNALGSLFKAPTLSVVDDDTVHSVTMEFRVFFGVDTSTDTAQTTLLVGVGDDIGGDFVTTGGDNLVPGSMLGGASVAMEVSNQADAARLAFRVNDPFGSSLDATSKAYLGADIFPLTAEGDTGADAQTYNANATSGHEYLVSVTFIKGLNSGVGGLGLFDTVVRYSIAPQSGGPIDQSVTDDSIVLPAAFPYNRSINQIFLGVGNDFGQSPSQLTQQSWADDITVTADITDPRPSLPPSSARGWTLYKDK